MSNIAFSRNDHGRITLVVIMSTAITALGSLFLAAAVDANGADERYVDGMLVGFSMAPIAPFVGEKVEMLISFRDAETGQYLASVSQANVTVEAFLVGEEQDGKVIFESGLTDASAGSFNVQYEFPHEGLYDIHVIFTAPDGKEQNVGYLRQIRSNSQQSGSMRESLFIPSLIAASFVSLVVGYRLARRRVFRKIP